MRVIASKNQCHVVLDCHTGGRLSYVCLYIVPEATNLRRIIHEPDDSSATVAAGSECIQVECVKSVTRR